MDPDPLSAPDLTVTKVRLLVTKAPNTILHRDDGLVPTRVVGETLAELELLVIRKFMPTTGKVLEVGCGHGRTCHYLESIGFDPVGVELDSPTVREAAHANGRDSLVQFVLADGRQLCFRDESFDFVISFASTLSEKHRLWMEPKDRIAFILEAVRMTRPGGMIVVNFVHRYWNLVGFMRFLRHYWMWMIEKLTRKRTELGDYVEDVGGTPIRFHAFTIREARSLFPRGEVSLEVWKRGGGPFTDWFFVIAKKTSTLPS
jgi:SAM-dependent methyltransferase